MHLRTAALALAAAAALTACSDDPDPAPVASGSPTSSEAPSRPSPSAPPSAGPSPSVEPDQPALPVPTTPPSPAGDSPFDTEEPSGDVLTITAVRVAAQAGFDRVVFELDGGEGADGLPGWMVRYDDMPSQDGSGDPVAVDGEAVLAVVVTGVGVPFDTGVDEVSEDPDLPGDLRSVQDVVLVSQFEGQYQAFIGVDAERPFSVTRLPDPPRLVVDIAHR